MLPELPDGFFGWMPVLYRVTEEQVLACAGLDAFVVCAMMSRGRRDEGGGGGRGQAMIWC